MIHGDLTFEFGDLHILIHENDYDYFNGTKLDFVKEERGNGRFLIVKE